MSHGISALSKFASFARAALLDRRPMVAYVGGWLGKRNLGDEALFAAYQVLFPKVKLIPYDGGRMAGQFVRYAPRFRGAILGGGTLIGQKRRWLHVTRRYLELNPNLAIFGTGVADHNLFPDEPGLAEWAPLLKRCSYLGVRGPNSARRLAEAGLDRIEVVGDPVIVFARPAVNARFQPNSLGLNIGSTGDRMWGTEDAVRGAAIRLASLARNAGWSIKWLVVYPQDLTITLDAARRSGTDQDIQTIYDNPGQFIEQARQLSVFAGMKLHATILAVCSLTPSVMFEYRSKCRDFMQSINQGAHTFRTDALDADKIWELLRHWNDQRNGVAQDLARQVHMLQARQRSLAQRLTESLVLTTA